MKTNEIYAHLDSIHLNTMRHTFENIHLMRCCFNGSSFMPPIYYTQNKNTFFPNECDEREKEEEKSRKTQKNANNFLPTFIAHFTGKPN